MLQLTVHRVVFEVCWLWARLWLEAQLTELLRSLLSALSPSLFIRGGECP